VVKRGPGLPEGVGCCRAPPNWTVPRLTIAMSRAAPNPRQQLFSNWRHPLSRSFRVGGLSFPLVLDTPLAVDDLKLTHPPQRSARISDDYVPRHACPLLNHHTEAFTDLPGIGTDGKELGGSRALFAVTGTRDNDDQPTQQAAVILLSAQKYCPIPRSFPTSRGIDRMTGYSEAVRLSRGKGIWAGRALLSACLPPELLQASGTGGDPVVRNLRLPAAAQKCERTKWSDGVQVDWLLDERLSAPRLATKCPQATS